MKNMFFSFKPLMVYNPDVIMVTAMRGCGKSFAAKVRVLNAFLNMGKCFIWMRRTEEQLKETKDTFLNDVLVKYPEKYKNFAIIGKRLYYLEKEESTYTDKNGDEITREIITDKVVVGYFLALNTASNAKGLSTPNIGTIVFDEFIEEDNAKYLKNELTKFNSIISTTARLSNPLLLMLSNSLSACNPYFEYFDIKLPNSGHGIVSRETEQGLRIVSQFGYDNESYKNATKNSLASKIASLGEYYASSVEDKFILDDNTFVVPKNILKGRFDYKYNIYFNGKAFGVYFNESKSMFWVSKELNGDTFVLSDIKEVAKRDRSYPINKKHPIITSLISNYGNGYVCFENVKYNNIFTEMANYCMGVVSKD